MIDREGGAGGEGGIRTHEGLPHTAFPVPRPRPLGDLSGRLPSRWRGPPRWARVRVRGPVVAATADADGGEGGIRTHGAFAHRFSRAAPSTTRTPLRGRV